jgi:hypothetical protein
MITAHELLRRKRKSRRLAAKAYRKVRLVYGRAAALALYREANEMWLRAHAPGGDAYRAIKHKPCGLQALFSDFPPSNLQS